ncbi:DNA adenine methylase [Mesorhizobium sp. B2-6-3]|uniref:DNA adenine methylase n=1 Tax=Mesorhizobium sp. B2-6-3 TaxID=2589914 RepID=UPI00112EC325|nr:DNA adenine methylase [Mesorhizobium sp. B2-6-3]TPJ75811.1 DNA adenine methylase [Mesorhizobium sp. B2-6-3]
MRAPTRPVLRWHGGKWKLAPWIISHFPAHKVYVEPFGGAASVLLQKDPAPCEVWNDLDGSLVNLFRVLRDAPADLQRALDLTPYARGEYPSLYEPCEEPVEAARRFIARSFMGQSSKGAVRKSGFDSRINGDGYLGRLNSLRGITEELPIIARRMSSVMLEQADARTVIKRYDRADALIYADPPYLPETRNSKSKVYQHDLDRDDHQALLEALVEFSGMVVLSGYPDPLYDDALSGWRRIETRAYADGALERTEVVWLNARCAEALDRRAGGACSPLFDRVRA